MLSISSACMHTAGRNVNECNSIWATQRGISVHVVATVSTIYRCTSVQSWMKRI